MASLSDLLTATKNVAEALNNNGQGYLNVQGAQSRAALSAATVVKSSSGRLATVVVTTAGTTTGAVYDANQTGVTTYPIYIIPNTIGVYVVNMPTNYGITVAPGSGQIVAVSFS
jgi:hypothetical protein